jgi:hypothetical protein
VPTKCLTLAAVVLGCSLLSCRPQDSGEGPSDGPPDGATPQAIQDSLDSLSAVEKNDFRRSIRWVKRTAAGLELGYHERFGPEASRPGRLSLPLHIRFYDAGKTFIKPQATVHIHYEREVGEWKGEKTYRLRDEYTHVVRVKEVPAGAAYVAAGWSDHFTKPVPVPELPQPSGD